MRKQDFEIRTKIIGEVFDDTRPIKCSVDINELNLPEHIHSEGNFFLTHDCEFIDLEFQFNPFSEHELVKYVELAEELYEKSKKEVSIYIICPKDVPVYVNESEIMSDATFKIKLAVGEISICKLILDFIKAKIRNNEKLTNEDIMHLKKLPLICRKEERHYYRIETFKIINRLHY
ncbi:hypothetical protein [Methanobrevibacter sp.]|uniref:hypothetical protein n=1 Tax=Methanobrevibacter sp. TaxID=66852 RepID=UPI00388DF9BE